MSKLIRTMTIKRLTARASKLSLKVLYEHFLKEKPVIVNGVKYVVWKSDRGNMFLVKEEDMSAKKLERYYKDSTFLKIGNKTFVVDKGKHGLYYLNYLTPLERAIALEQRKDWRWQRRKVSD